MILITIVKIIVPVLLTIIFFTLNERLVMSSMQCRLAPQMSGLSGIVQPFMIMPVLGLRGFLSKEIYCSEQYTGLLSKLIFAFFGVPCLFNIHHSALFISFYSHVMSLLDSDALFAMCVSFIYFCFTYTSKINHSLTETVFCTFKNVWKSSDSPKKPYKNWFEAYVKFILWLLFSIGYFFFYTKTGICLYAVSFLVNFFYYDVPYAQVFLVDFCRLAFGLGFSVFIELYILVQFSYTRNLLIEVIGQHYFNLYLGSNPGSEWLKLGLSITAAVSLSALFADSVNKYTGYHKQRALAQTYVELCVEHGKDWNPDDVAKIMLQDTSTVHSAVHKKA